MKKIFALALALSMSLSLAACGGTNNDGNSVSSNPGGASSSNGGASSSNGGASSSTGDPAPANSVTLKQGTYDAQENPIPVIYNNNLYEVQAYLSVTNHIYSGLCFTIAESSWNKLSADQQAIVEAAAKASADYDRELNKQMTDDLVSSLEQAGMKINNPDLVPFAEATASVLTDNTDTYGDLLTKLADWKAAR